MMAVEKEIIAAIMAVIALGCLILLIKLPNTIPSGKTSYIVEMNEAIDYNEFYEKYKVIEHYEYTNIYVVEEK